MLCFRCIVMKTIKSLFFAGATLFASTAITQAHCQVPCGIYDDNARVVSMLEDAATASKAIKMINELAGKTDAQSQNQLARWVMNKESHAQKVIASIADYFLTQRVKSSQEDYQDRLVKHHEVIVLAMKVKQGVDAEAAENLAKAISALESYYPKK